MVEVRVSTLSQPEAGRGLFATRHHRRHEYLTEYGGVRLTKAEADRERQAGFETGWFASTRTGYVLDGRFVSAEDEKLASFANDARDPARNNARLVPRWNHRTAQEEVWLKATRDIESGEEIFCSYGRAYWN